MTRSVQAADGLCGWNKSVRGTVIRVGKCDKRKVCPSKRESDEAQAHGLQWETMGRFKSMRDRERGRKMLAMVHFHSQSNLRGRK